MMLRKLYTGTDHVNKWLSQNCKFYASLGRRSCSMAWPCIYGIFFSSNSIFFSKFIDQANWVYNEGSTKSLKLYASLDMACEVRGAKGGLVWNASVWNIYIIRWIIFYFYWMKVILWWHTLPLHARKNHMLTCDLIIYVNMQRKYIDMQHNWTFDIWSCTTPWLLIVLGM